VKKTGMAAITVAALLSLSHVRAVDITGDILHEDCFVASPGSGSDRDCDIYINGLAAGVLVDQVAKEQGTLSVFRPALRRNRFAMLSRNSCRSTQTCCTQRDYHRRSRT
jgi:hypothetical protein